LGYSDDTVILTSFLDWFRHISGGQTPSQARNLDCSVVGRSAPVALGSSGELVKDKINIRYLEFRSGHDGGRIFDFCISTTEHADVLTSVEVPTELLTGTNRIRLQEGVGISYAKLKHLVEVGPFSELPNRLCLTASDVAQYREVLPTTGKHKSSIAATHPVE
jgi:hypothetical protein